MEGLKRIALYGGSFDPVHAGHLTVAASLLKLFALDEVLFIPAHVAPHKRGARVTPPPQRYAMLALATQDDERLKVSSVEIEAPEKPYTVDTLSRMQTELGSEAQLFFIMGADSWMEITTWREWERVLTLSSHIVVTRPGYEVSAEHVTPAIRERVVDLVGASFERIRREVDRSDAPRIYITDAVRMDVSSTAIRKLIGAGGGESELDGLVPKSVAEFIRKYELYRRPA